MPHLGSEDSLRAAATALARGERSSPALAALWTAIAAGGDPLGEAFGRLRDPALRRRMGATYTPPGLVATMVGWAAAGMPDAARVIDPGAGSGRFLGAAASRFPGAALLAVEVDPLAVALLRANAVVQGWADRLTVLEGDYRAVALPPCGGPTLFLGNPPYVRHHGIETTWKSWYAETAARYGVTASRLAGLHLHFFLRTLELGRAGDLGVFITAAEWLDTNYGAALRALLAGPLGGLEVHRLEATVAVFPDAMTTAVITGFRIGRRSDSLRIRTVSDHGLLADGTGTGRSVPWTEVGAARRWSVLFRPGPRHPAGDLELGEVYRVHRGQVTGCNRVWIAGPHTPAIPARFLIPTVTRAGDLTAAGEALCDPARLRRVIDLPADLRHLPGDERDVIDRFLAWAERNGAATSYVARARRAWWSVGLRDPAPIVCTYMGRRPPVFVRNRAGARLLNIAHGLYPRVPLDDGVTDAVVRWLRGNVGTDGGRVYAGGLTKFEPREVERLSVPAHLFAAPPPAPLATQSPAEAPTNGLVRRSAPIVDVGP